MVEKRPDFKLIKSFDKTEPIVAMIKFKEKIYLATSWKLYVLKEDKLEPVPMYIEDES